MKVFRNIIKKKEESKGALLEEEDNAITTTNAPTTASDNANPNNGNVDDAAMMHTSSNGDQNRVYVGEGSASSDQNSTNYTSDIQSNVNTEEPSSPVSPRSRSTTTAAALQQSPPQSRSIGVLLFNTPDTRSELPPPPIYMPDFDVYDDSEFKQKEILFRAGIRRETSAGHMGRNNRRSMFVSPHQARKGTLLTRVLSKDAVADGAPLMGDDATQPTFITNFDASKAPNRKGTILGGARKDLADKEKGKEKKDKDKEKEREKERGKEKERREGERGEKKQRDDYEKVDDDVVDDDPNDETDRPVFIIKTLEDLPKEELAAVKKSKIEQEKFEQNLNILANVLTFTKHKEKKVFKVENQPPRPHRDTSKIYVSPGVHNPADGLTDEMLAHYFETGDPKDAIKLGEYEGEGGFGRVFAGRCRAPRNASEKERVAVKMMSHKKDREVKMNLNEIGVLKYCNHPNIVKYFRSYLRNTDEVWLILEFLEGGTLKEASRNFSFTEPQIAYISREMLKAIAYLHENQLVHRDLKSANVMLSMKGEVKLIDFGLCFDMSATPEEVHMCGSPFWMPPEMIRHEPHSWPADIWSFAICIVEMIKRKVPNHKSRFKAMFLVGSEGVTFDKEEEKWSDELYDFLTKCLRMDPKERPTAKELLEHPFLTKAASLREIQQIMPPIFLSNTMQKQGIL